MAERTAGSDGLRPLPDEVRDVMARYLRALDAALPGFASVVYLTGSVALDAFQPGRSDVDALVVTARPAGAADLAAIGAVHAGLRGRPHVDAVYLDRVTFAAQPADGRVVPYVVNGEFRAAAPCGELNPVLWLTLRRYGVPVRGPAVGELGLRTDPAALRRWNLDNLRAYWQPWAEGARRETASWAANAPVDGEVVSWGVLGPARLHFTLASEDVTTKAGAGAYLARHFPAWAALADRALAWRGGGAGGFTVADLREAADAVDAVAADAWRRWG
jgi:hypothetical protein